MSRKKQIIKDTFQLTIARYTSQGLGFFISIAIRKFLGPFYIGIWSLFKVILDYASYLLLGVNEGLCYKIPLLSSKNDTAAEQETKNSVFSFVFFISLLSSLALITTAFILRNTIPLEVFIGLLALSAYLILDRICGYYMLVLRAKKEFSILSKAIVFDAVLNLILVFLLVRKLNIYGLYATVIILCICNTIFIHKYAKYRIDLKFKFKGIGEIMKAGLPIAFSSFLEGILSTIDRIMIGKMIGIVFVGYYSIPIMTKSYIAQLSSFGTVLYPHIIETFGQNENIEEVKKFVLIPPLINAYILPAVLGIIFFTAPLLITVVLPKFIPGILAMQILLIDMYFRSCYPQAFHFLIALKKQARSIPIVVGAIIFTIIGNYVLIKKGYGINGVAITTSIASFLSFLAMQTYAMKHFAKPKEIFKYYLEFLAPFIYAFIVIILVDKFININNLYISVMVKNLVFLAIISPLLFYIEKKTQIISLIINMLKERFHAKKS